MPEYIEVLKEARSLLVRDNQEVTWQGEFVSLSTDLHMSAFEQKTLATLYTLIQHIVQDIWNICVIVHRLAWMREAALKNEFLKNMWNLYASADIEHFHVELRSIMDYVAEILSRVADKKGQIPKSYRELLQWLSKNPANRNRLGEDLALVTESAEWFFPLRDVRDTIIHRGAFTLVFGKPDDGILFQVHKGFVKRLITSEHIMYNENVAFFDRYAAIYFSHLLTFLERLAKVLNERLKLKSIDGKSQCTWPGFSVFAHWIEQLILLLERNE